MTLELFKLDGKVALVTGAAGGLGQGIAIALGEAGASVALLDIRSCDAAIERITATGADAFALRADLASCDAERAAEYVVAAIHRFGRLDVLVNNAGIIRRAAAVDYCEEDWREVLSVNLDAAFLLSQAAARYWIQNHRPGKIINICSMLSFQGGLRVPAYTASKSGLAGLTRALANEWAPLGINVNGIAPGYFATEVTAALREDPDRNAAILSRIPAGRWGETADLAGAAVFLASAASDYIHGAILPVDGGWLAY